MGQFNREVATYSAKTRICVYFCIQHMRTHPQHSHCIKRTMLYVTYNRHAL